MAPGNISAKRATHLLASGGVSAITRMLCKDLSDCTFGFVGAAAELSENPFWLNDARAELEGLNLRLREIDLKHGVRAAQWTNELSDLDGIYMAGGNSYHLLKRIRETHFDIAIVEFVNRGGLYVGVSAGAIVCGPDIAVTAEPSQRELVPGLDSTKGLGIVPFATLPHAGSQVENGRFFAHHNNLLQQEAFAKHNIMRITDSEGIVVYDDGSHELVWSPRIARHRP